jgi:hypothetical protein
MPDHWDGRVLPPQVHDVGWSLAEAKDAVRADHPVIANFPSEQPTGYRE